MAVQRGLGDDHEVLSRNAFCSGYVDSFGKWNNGFACPSLEEEEVFCCGTSTYRYCCTIIKPERTASAPTATTTTTTSEDVEDKIAIDNLPLLLGVTLGALVTVIIVAIIACCLCRVFRKRGGTKPDRLPPPEAVTAVSNMYSYSANSLARRDASRAGRHELDSMLHEVDEVAVTPTRHSRFSGVNGNSSMPRTFATYRSEHRSAGNRASFADSVGNSSVSSTTDNERQLFIEQGGIPPPYNFNKLSSGGGDFETALPYPPSFTSGADHGSGHYLAGMSPNDDSFYSANKL